MGKKSLQGLNSDYLTPTETTMVTQMDRYQGLFEALMQHKNQQRQMVPKAADRRLRSGWREESTHVREVGLWNLFVAVAVNETRCYSLAYFFAVDVRPASQGFETAGPWIHLNSRGDLHVIF